jgi:hypothetical protein
MVVALELEVGGREEAREGKRQTHMVNNLVRDPAIVLQDVIVDGPRSCDEFLDHGL